MGAGLDYLNGADVASLTTAEQADCLRALEQAISKHTAARSRVLAAFHAQDGCTDDVHGSTQTWLKWADPDRRRRRLRCDGVDAAAVGPSRRG